MQDFRKLKVWKKAHELTLLIYKISKKFPKEEMFSLSSQIRRASSSIPSNIAEGCGRGTDKDFARFIQISMGSASELEYLILLSFDLKYIANDNFKVLIDETIDIKKMLSSLLKTLRANG
jgi:four helix bundle protein